jgi:hypothetical protein
MQSTDMDVAPLTHTLSKLSTTQELDSLFAIPTGSTRKPRHRSKSLSLQFTPGIRKPVPEFHSTGLLSKKNHSKQQSAITPETPVKQKTLLEGIWKAPLSETPLKPLQPFSISDSPISHTPYKPKPPLTPFGQPTLIPGTSAKSNRLHRSPLKESPTKINKRPHLLSSSPVLSRFGGNAYEPTSPISQHYFENSGTPVKNTPKRIQDSFESPPVVSKTFFSKLVKDRQKQSNTMPIPFSALISRQRIVINTEFFNALQGLTQYEIPSLNEIPHADYFEKKFQMISRLGQGEFADAFHVKSLEDGVDYAVKKTRQSFTGYKDAVYKLEEVKMLLRIGVDPHCVSLKEAWIQFGYIYIQMELCNQGNLSNYLDIVCSEGPLAEDQIWRIMADLIQVVFIN